MNRLRILFCAIGFFTIQGCEIIDPTEEIPSYIKIDSVIFDDVVQTTKITDVWVNVDGDPIGAYEIPAIFPVIASEGQEIQIKPGIKKNGMSEARLAYPFYKIYYTKPNFVEGETYNITPHFSYVDDMEIVWEEDFETSIYPGFDHSSQSDTVMRINSSECIYGNYCGSIVLESDQEVYEGYANQTFVLPQNSTPIYLEFNYKSTDIIGVGIYARTTSAVNQETVLYVAKSDEWNKIYVNLTEAVVKYQSAIDYSFYFAIVRIENTERIEAYIDNVKLIKLI